MAKITVYIPEIHYRPYEVEDVNTPEEAIQAIKDGKEDNGHMLDRWYEDWMQPADQVWKIAMPDGKKLDWDGRKYAPSTSFGGVPLKQHKARTRKTA